MGYKALRVQVMFSDAKYEANGCPDFKSCVNTFTTKGFSETEPFRRFGNHSFRSQEFQKYLNYKVQFFFKMFRI